MMGLLFDTSDPNRTHSAALMQVQRRTARLGVTLPWSPAADAFLQGAAPSGASLTR
jgi:hypothetical protein